MTITTKKPANQLSAEVLQELQNHCNEGGFDILNIDGKRSAVLRTPEWTVKHLQRAGHDIILTFIKWSKSDSSNLDTNKKLVFNNRDIVLESSFVIDELKHGDKIELLCYYAKTNVK